MNWYKRKGKEALIDEDGKLVGEIIYSQTSFIAKAYGKVIGMYANGKSARTIVDKAVGNDNTQSS